MTRIIARVLLGSWLLATCAAGCLEVRDEPEGELGGADAGAPSMPKPADASADGAKPSVRDASPHDARADAEAGECVPRELVHEPCGVCGEKVAYCNEAGELQPFG